jgi:hypothetical protein
MIYIGFILFILAGFCEAVMDKIQFHYDISIFKYFKNQLFWDPRISWKNKYKDGDPLKGEKFFLSKSLLVGFTDAWHLFKLFRTLFIFSGIYSEITFLLISYAIVLILYSLQKFVISLTDTASLLPKLFIVALLIPFPSL